MVFLACSILCCLILMKSLSVFDSERDPLKEEELLTSNRLCLFSCQAVSNTFKKSLKFLTKLVIPLSFKCSFPLFKCFFTLILSCEIVSVLLFSQNSLSRVFTFSVFVSSFFVVAALGQIKRFCFLDTAFYCCYQFLRFQEDYLFDDYDFIF